MMDVYGIVTEQELVGKLVPFAILAARVSLRDDDPLFNEYPSGVAVGVAARCRRLHYASLAIDSLREMGVNHVNEAIAIAIALGVSRDESKPAYARHDLIPTRNRITDTMNRLDDDLIERLPAVVGRPIGNDAQPTSRPIKRVDYIDCATHQLVKVAFVLVHGVVFVSILHAQTISLRENGDGGEKMAHYLFPAFLAGDGSKPQFTSIQAAEKAGQELRERLRRLVVIP